MKVLEGFDPSQDAIDRRILFEVTGIRLYKDEFNESSSEDSDEGNSDISHTQEVLLDIDYAMMLH